PFFCLPLYLLAHAYQPNDSPVLRRCVCGVWTGNFPGLFQCERIGWRCFYRLGTVVAPAQPRCLTLSGASQHWLDASDKSSFGRRDFGLRSLLRSLVLGALLVELDLNAG